MKNLFNVLLVSVFFLIIVISCDDTIAPNDEIPSSNVSYSQHIQPIFNVSCALSGCHDDVTASAGLRLTTWFNVTANPQIVFPGEPDNSKLVWAIEGNPTVTPMPPIFGNVAPLTIKQINGIKTWIAEGAKNN